jgi:hypothetical protein
MIDVMKQALEALEKARDDILGWAQYATEYFQQKHDLAADLAQADIAIIALRRAIEEAEKPDRTGMTYYRHNDCNAKDSRDPDCICWTPAKQEPVAWWNPTTDNASTDPYYRNSKECIPLYTAPPKREWVNLTDEQIEKIVDQNTSDDGGFDIFCDGHSIARLVMAKLQDLNK